MRLLESLLALTVVIAALLRRQPAPRLPAGVDAEDLEAGFERSDVNVGWVVLGSVALQRYHRLRTTDVNVKPAALRELPVPRALLQGQAAGALAVLARARAAEAAAARAPTREKNKSCLRGSALPLAPPLERAIDAAVYRLFGLEEAQVEEAERGFWGPRFPVEFPRLAQECQAPRVA